MTGWFYPRNPIATQFLLYYTSAPALSCIPTPSSTPPVQERDSPMWPSGLPLRVLPPQEWHSTPAPRQARPGLTSYCRVSILTHVELPHEAGHVVVLEVLGQHFLSKLALVEHMKAVPTLSGDTWELCVVDRSWGLHKKHLPLGP